jgi:CTP synthase
MRLGAYECDFVPGTLGEKIYKTNKITERHRHRLEVNNEYIKQLTDKGLVVSGKNPGLNLVEVIELKDHPYFIACQYHPEFKSRPFKPHPLFASFVKACGKL